MTAIENSTADPTFRTTLAGITEIFATHRQSMHCLIFKAVLLKQMFGENEIWDSQDACVKAISTKIDNFNANGRPDQAPALVNAVNELLEEQRLRNGNELAVLDEVFDVFEEADSYEAMDEDVALPQEAEEKIAAFGKEVEAQLERYRDGFKRFMIIRGGRLTGDTFDEDAVLEAYLFLLMKEAAKFLQQQASPLTTAFTNEDEYLRIFKALLISFYRIGEAHREAVKVLEDAIAEDEASRTVAGQEEVDKMIAHNDVKREEMHAKLDEMDAEIAAMHKELDARERWTGHPSMSEQALTEEDRAPPQEGDDSRWTASSRCARPSGRFRRYRVKGLSSV